MKSYVRIILSLLLVLGVAVISLPMAFSQEKAIAEKQISGEITAIDLNKSTLGVKSLKDVVKQIYEEVTLTLDASTIIEKDTLKVSISQLAVGDKATVKYVTKNGKNIATSISVTTQK